MGATKQSKSRKVSCLPLWSQASKIRLGSLWRPNDGVVGSVRPSVPIGGHVTYMGFVKAARTEHRRHECFWQMSQNSPWLAPGGVALARLRQGLVYLVVRETHS